MGVDRDVISGLDDEQLLALLNNMHQAGQEELARQRGVASASKAKIKKELVEMGMDSAALEGMAERDLSRLLSNMKDSEEKTKKELMEMGMDQKAIEGLKEHELTRLLKNMKEAAQKEKAQKEEALKALARKEAAWKDAARKEGERKQLKKRGPEGDAELEKAKSLSVRTLAEEQSAREHEAIVESMIEDKNRAIREAVFEAETKAAIEASKNVTPSRTATTTSQPSNITGHHRVDSSQSALRPEGPTASKSPPSYSSIDSRRLGRVFPEQQFRSDSNTAFDIPSDSTLPITEENLRRTVQNAIRGQTLRTVPSTVQENAHRNAPDAISLNQTESHENSLRFVNNFYAPVTVIVNQAGSTTHNSYPLTVPRRRPVPNRRAIQDADSQSWTTELPSSPVGTILQIQSIPASPVNDEAEAQPTPSTPVNVAVEAQSNSSSPVDAVVETQRDQSSPAGVAVASESNPSPTTAEVEKLSIQPLLCGTTCVHCTYDNPLYNIRCDKCGQDLPVEEKKSLNNDDVQPSNGSAKSATIPQSLVAGASPSPHNAATVASETPHVSYPDMMSFSVPEGRAPRPPTNGRVATPTASRVSYPDMMSFNVQGRRPPLNLPPQIPTKIPVENRIGYGNYRSPYVEDHPEDVAGNPSYPGYVAPLDTGSIARSRAMSGQQNPRRNDNRQPSAGRFGLVSPFAKQGYQHYRGDLTKVAEEDNEDKKSIASVAVHPPSSPAPPEMARTRDPLLDLVGVPTHRRGIRGMADRFSRALGRMDRDSEHLLPLEQELAENARARRGPRLVLDGVKQNKQK